MKNIKVATASVNQTPMDWEGNTKRIICAIEEAKKEKVSLLCLPEMSITGYGCEDMFFSIDLQERAWDCLKKIVEECIGIQVMVGLPVSCRGALYNCAAFISNKQIKGLIAKQFLAGDGIHYEPRWFKPWPKGVNTKVVKDGEEIDIGDIYFDCGPRKERGVIIGAEICEDAWVANRPGIRLADRGVDIICNPSASHFAFSKIETRERFVIEGSRAFGATYLYSNLNGNESGRAIYDGGCLIATNGSLIKRGKRFSFKEVQLTTAKVDVDITRINRTKSFSFRPDLERGIENRIKVEFDYPVIENNQVETEVKENIEWGDFQKEEEFTRSVALGLFDYLRKSRSKGFVISLSGGADSAACAVLVEKMVELGLQEGIEEFKEKLNYIQSIQDKTERKEFVKEILCCIYQGTKNSSFTTLDAAREVTKGIGATFYNVDIDKQVNEYVSLAENCIGEKFTWEQDDITLQNVQARSRSVVPWILANKRESLLLSTSNRSEAAVGYATMDGDTAGGLAPIAGIDKNFLRAWLKWAETKGGNGITPIPILDKINTQAPTAELRPSLEELDKQTDEKDLMPYEVLNFIEKCFVRDKESPKEIYVKLLSNFTVKEDDAKMWVEKFFRLWSRNQWKRERYAPSFHLDEESLDPKTWCRFPILNKGFKVELEEIKL